MFGSGDPAEEGAPAGLVGFSSRYLDRALEMVAMGAYVIDPELRVIRLSARAARMLQAGDGPVEMPLEEYRSRFYYPEDRVAFEAQAERQYAVGQSLSTEVRLRRTDGSAIWVRAGSSNEFDEQGRACIVGVVQDIGAQKAAEIEREMRLSLLRESELLLRATFDHALVGACLVSTAGRFLRVNGALCRLLGYSEEELSQLTFSDITHPEDRQVGLDIMMRALAGDPAPAEFDKRYLHKDGRTLWAHVSTAVVTTDFGRQPCFVAHIEDTTRLRKSEERFRTVFASVPSALSVSDAADGRMVDINPEFERIFGWSKAEVVGRTSVELGMWEDARAREASMQSIAWGQDPAKTKELVMRRRDGELRTFLSATQLFEFGAERLLVSAFVDSTEQLRAEQERLRAEQRYRDLVEGVRDVVFALDSGGVIISLNPAFERITGLSRASWVGRHFEEMIHADDVERARGELDRAISVQSQEAPPLRLKKEDGGYWLADIRMAPRFEDGQLVSLLGIGRDISDRFLLEESLRQAQKMEAVGVLAGGIAHDFNNILGVILGYAALLVPQFESSDPKRPQMLEIQASAERASALTRQLMAFSRKQVLQPKVVDLNRTLTGVSNMLGRLLGNDVSLVVLPLAEHAWVHADPGQLEQVLMNLAVNARDAMPRGGTLTLQLRRIELEEPRIEAPGLAPGVYLRLAVADTGEGMDKATQAHIFEPFFTTKAIGKGTGLGLATVFGIVKQSGGHVAVESEPGSGAIFYVWLPASTEVGTPERASDVDAVALRAIGNGETILLVDDDGSMRGLTSTILRGAGYEVLEAQSGGDALIVVERHAEIDLVLTDVVMPLMSGDQLVERLAKSRPEIRAIFMSGNPDQGAETGRQLGSAPFLQKPFTPEELLQIVGKTLPQSEPSSERAPRTLRTERSSEPPQLVPARLVPTRASLADLLGAVPPVLLEELRVAVVQARPRLIEQVVTRIAEHSAPAAHEIERLSKQFRYDPITAAIARVQSHVAFRDER